MGVIGELSKSVEFKDFALAAIQDSKEKTAKTIGERLGKLKEYSANVRVKLGEMNLSSCDPAEVLALQEMSNDLYNITMALPRGGTQ